MNKLVLLPLIALLFAPLGYSLSFGGEAVVDVGLVLTPRLFPPKIGEALDENALAEASIASFIKNNFIAKGKFNTFCQYKDDRETFEKKLDKRLKLLSLSQACQGVQVIRDSCSYSASYLCEPLKSGECSSISVESLKSQCVTRNEAEREEAASNSAVFELASKKRCEVAAKNAAQACEAGASIDVSTKIAPSSALKRMCEDSNFVYRIEDGVAICGKSGSAALPIMVDRSSINARGQESENGGVFDSQGGELTSDLNNGLYNDENQDGVLDNGALNDDSSLDTVNDLFARNNVNVDDAVTGDAKGSDETNSGDSSSGSDVTPFCPTGPSSCNAGYELVISQDPDCGIVKQCVAITAPGDSASTSSTTPASTSSTTPTVTYTCTDSDNGNNPLVRGTLRRVSSGGGLQTYSDSCSGSTLTEYYCAVDNSFASAQITCPSGSQCLNGACKTTCSDTDGGDTTAVKGTVTYINSLGVTVAQTDSCITSSTSQVNEFYCQNGAMVQTSHYCSSGQMCSNGACINDPGACTDTDSTSSGGVQPRTAGVVTKTYSNGSSYTFRDTCASSTSLTEYFCLSKEAWKLTYSCTCSNSACTSSPNIAGAQTPISGQLIAPFTVKIIAIPSMLSAFVTSDEGEEVTSESDESDAGSSEQSCSLSNLNDQCRDSIRTKRLLSYTDEEIEKTCTKESESLYAKLSKYCEADNPTNECKAEVQTYCQLAQPAVDQCKDIVLNDGVREMILTAVSAACENPEAFLAEFDAPSLNSQDDMMVTAAQIGVTEANVAIDQATESKDVVYEMQKLACMKTQDEKKEAQECSKGVTKLSNTINLLESILENQNDSNKAVLNQALSGLKKDLQESKDKCGAKLKNAGGVCSMFGG